MKFVLRMAWREMRSAWKRLIFFFVCIALGTGSIVAIRSAIRNFNDVITGDARGILTADIQLDATRPWVPKVLGIINTICAQPYVSGRVETIEAATMMRPADSSMKTAILIELKGIESPFPFYGS